MQFNERTMPEDPHSQPHAGDQRVIILRTPRPGDEVLFEGFCPLCRQPLTERRHGMAFCVPCRTGWRASSGQGWLGELIEEWHPEIRIEIER